MALDRHVTAPGPSRPSSTWWDLDAYFASASEPELALDVLEIPLVHELGTGQHANVITATRRIEPSRRPVLVKIESQVVGHAAQRLQSADYMGTVRRRKCRELANAVTDLCKGADRDDFAVCTYPVVTKINALLATLANAETEGNTREMLRQLRNTFMNGGWVRYRDPSACGAALDVFRFLQEAEEVLPQKVDEVFHKLAGAGLNAVGLPLTRVDED